MNIKIIAVGKIKEPFVRDAIKEYSKRLSRYCQLNIVETSEKQAPQNISQADIEKIKEEEGNFILQQIKSGEYVIALAIEGVGMSSEQLAAHLADVTLSGYSTITFIIGGSLGLSSKIINKADMVLSFSPMTFPHQLMRLILLEQIYRCFKINNNEPYHK